MAGRNAAVACPTAGTSTGDILLLDNYIPVPHRADDAGRRSSWPDRSIERLPVFEDWDLLIRLSSSSSFVHLARATCEYRHFLGATAGGPSGGHALGGAAAERRDFEALKAQVLSKHAAELDSEALAAAVTRMRRQAVLAGEAARAQIRDREAELEGMQADIAARPGEGDQAPAGARA